MSDTKRTDTPRTDSIDTYQPFIVSEPKYNALAELARTLERELAAEKEKVRELREALKPFAKFAAMMKEKPMNGLCDTIKLVHGGTQWEAELTLTACNIARATLEKTA